MGTGFLTGMDIFHGYGFGTAKPSGFVPVAISSNPCIFKAKDGGFKVFCRHGKEDWGVVRCGAGTTQEMGVSENQVHGEVEEGTI
jgi:hypothetical protein